jgi:hypothetical protein
VAGYYSMQELSKCIRDIRYLKPDMVISFSGINDNGKLLWNSGMINGLDGVMRNYSENSFAYWLENEAMMQQTAEESGAKFFCIAQPQLYQREKLNKYEYLSTMYDRNNDFSGTDPKWIDKVKHIKENYPWMVDMTDILDDYDVYIDHEHVTTEGNEIIAQHIYDYIKDEIK